MARYTGKPKPSKPDRFEVARCGKGLYGVYDNEILGFVQTDVTKEEATEIKWQLQGVILDRALINLYKRCANL